jgi:hypothetical protein
MNRQKKACQLTRLYLQQTKSSKLKAMFGLLTMPCLIYVELQVDLKRHRSTRRKRKLKNELKISTAKKWIAALFCFSRIGKGQAPRQRKAFPIG